MSVQFLKEEELPSKVPLREDKYSELPQLGLIFDSKRRVLHCDGFPSYMKSIFEMVECGSLIEFRQIEYMNAISRFGNT